MASISAPLLVADAAVSATFRPLRNTVTVSDTRTKETDESGRRVRRTMGIASLGGATLDNEENYLMKKLYSALGAVQIENQARI